MRLPAGLSAARPWMQSRTASGCRRADTSKSCQPTNPSYCIYTLWIYFYIAFPFSLLQPKQTHSCCQLDARRMCSRCTVRAAAWPFFVPGDRNLGEAACRRLQKHEAVAEGVAPPKKTGFIRGNLFFFSLASTRLTTQKFQYY